MVLEVAKTDGTEDIYSVFFYSRFCVKMALIKTPALFIFLDDSRREQSRPGTSPADV